MLNPKGINPTRRTSELTIAIIQLVASKRGIAALPFWAAKPYLDRGYIVAKKLPIRGYIAIFMPLSVKWMLK